MSHIVDVTLTLFDTIGAASAGEKRLAALELTRRAKQLRIGPERNAMRAVVAICSGGPYHSGISARVLAELRACGPATPHAIAKRLVVDGQKVRTACRHLFSKGAVWRHEKTGVYSIVAEKVLRTKVPTPVRRHPWTERVHPRKP